MLIESKIKRKDGTTVTMDGVTYHFSPDESGAHVCEVSHKRHIQRFLSISEGYCIAGAPDDEPVAKQEAAADDPLNGVDVVEVVDEFEEEGEEEEEEEDGDIDQLDLDELAERYAANGVKMDRRRSLRTLRSELRAIETGARE